jgi:hypothetical protein
MTPRLRRLDALFADKVLGHLVVYDIPDPERGETHSDDRWTEWLPGSPSIGGDTPLRPYTRSLDAAWEGAINLAKRQNAGYVSLTWWPEREDSDELIEATLPGPHSKCDACHSWESKTHVAQTSHPAEALVLACLRAVGVGEEELK